MLKSFRFYCFILLLSATFSFAQSPLFIPDTLSGTSFSLSIQTGTMNLIGSYITPTYGYNGNFLGPTLILKNNDSITLNVKNNLSQATTTHWHGLHVAPQNDGGPHQSISPGSTWSPSFKVRNEAATFWYHPHGDTKTELHVSKGLAGMIIVRDNIESTYILPRRYKVDDFPVIVQSKAFDVLYQIATATHEDSVVMVNGTINPFLQVPKQVVRLRLLNGSADRTYYFGLSDNSNFNLIASDGGLLSQPFLTNRVRVSPGERAEILVDFNTYIIGQQIYLKSYSSQLPKGIIGADSVGTASIVIAEGYYSNPLNGADFNVLRFDVIAQTVSPILTIPSTFAPKVPFLESSANAKRHLNFSPDTILSGQQGKVDGPFFINKKLFHMDTINIKTYLNNIEVWKLSNNTLVAHPFHIHDIEFFVLDINGLPPPPQYQGLKDVILVQPKDTVRFITKFTNFASPTVPYMYHCHLLHHEDEGMMGSFLVLDPNANGVTEIENENDYLTIYPNPSTTLVTIKVNGLEINSVLIYNSLGELIYDENNLNSNSLQINTAKWSSGIYNVKVNTKNHLLNKKIIIN